MEKYFYNLKRISDGKKIKSSFEPEDETVIPAQGNEPEKRFTRVSCVFTEITEPLYSDCEPGTIVSTFQVKLSPEQLDALVEPGFKKIFKTTVLNELLHEIGFELES